jgi:hypothetical protein
MGMGQRGRGVMLVCSGKIAGAKGNGFDRVLRGCEVLVQKDLLKREFLG